MAKRPRPKIGDTAWFVEWCHELAFYDDDPSGDVDHDRCKDSTKQVQSREEAEKVVRDVWPVAEKTFGHVRYWEAEFVPYDEDDAILYPHAGFWEERGDAEYYHGEDE